VIEGEDAIARVRALCGATKVDAALPGTIRGDYAMHTGLNIIHASDSNASAEREIGLFFEESEICAWKDGNDAWI
jgi:nucleoside-diphosphate kinase